MTGLIFNIQRHSTEDGPGIRTTVFLKGCPMGCPWCHNPEGINNYPQIVWYDTRCIGCGECLKACPQKALTLFSKGMFINRDACESCGICADSCPAAALELLGKRYSVEDAAGVALRDKVFYDTSGGGVTLSGGEPAMQPEFSKGFTEALKNEKIHVALDTCGGVSWKRLESLVQLADLVLYDLKIIDPDNHLMHTGIPLKPVLDNAVKIAETGKPMWVRTPVIPGYTDSEENIRSITRFILNNLPTTERYDLLAFNNTCFPKYRRLNYSFNLEKEQLVSESKMEELTRLAIDEGLDFVHWSGLTKKT